MQRLFDSEIESLRLFPNGGVAKDELGDDWQPAPDTLDLEASAGIGRREFITLPGGALLASPLAAQQGERLRHIGVLMTLAATDPQAQARNAAFLQGLHELGWTIGRNVQIDHHWAQALSTTRTDTRPNWPRLRRTSSWLPGAEHRSRWCRRPAPCRSCSWSSLIRSAPASSIAWRGPA